MHNNLKLLLPMFVLAALVACSNGGSGGEDSGGEDSNLHAEPVDDYPYPVQMLEDLTPLPGGEIGRHLREGETFDYNSDPPTNGRHSDQIASPGISDTPIPREQLVHNMEHANVVVWYNCNAGEQALSTEECAALRNDLSGVVQPAVAAGERVVMTPYPEMEHRIALTAWQFLDAFDEFDADRVQTFIEQFECYTDIEGFCD